MVPYVTFFILRGGREGGKSKRGKMGGGERRNNEVREEVEKVKGRALLLSLHISLLTSNLLGSIEGKTLTTSTFTPFSAAKQHQQTANK